MSRMSWVPTEEQPRTYTCEFGVIHFGWTEFVVQFTPQNSGGVDLNLMGPWEQSSQAGNPIFRQDVVWDNLSVSNTTIINGGFEIVSGTSPNGWSRNSTDATVVTGNLPLEGSRYARTWHDATFRQRLTVRAGEPVTLRFFARAHPPEGFVDNPRIMGTNTPAHQASAKFRRGVNYGNYFEAAAGEWTASYSSSDFDRTKSEGFDHVRIPVRWNDHTGPAPEYAIEESFAQSVDGFVNAALDRGLAVILNIHHFDELALNVDAHTNKFYRIWEQIAARYAARPAGLAFELLNEPRENATTTVMNPIYAEAIRRIRLTNPNRTIFVGPGNYNSISQMTALRLPANDTNLIVTVHSYDPFLFTHQGATWSGDAVTTVGVKYPGPPAAPLSPVAPSSGHTWVVDWFQSYNTLPTSLNPSSKAAFAGNLELARKWMDYYGRPVHVGEFGAIDRADVVSRANFYREMRETLDAVDLGWAMWDWKVGFRYWDAANNRPEPGMREAMFPTVAVPDVPAVITVPPAPQRVVQGTTVFFQVQATGMPAPSFQWRKGSAEIPGANQATLILALLQPSAEGEYSVVVWNRAGTNTATTRLDVVVPVAIATQPADRTMILGESATLAATANGTAPISWQWHFQNAMVPGQTAAVLNLSAVTAANEGNYFAIARNEAGSATTRVARVSVTIPVQIVTEPADRSALAGGSASFSVSAMGSAPLSYQWMRNGVPLEGRTEAVLVMNNVQLGDAGEYSVRIGNSAGFVTSRAALLTVTPVVLDVPPVITLAPTPQRVVQGGTATFQVQASGTPAPGFQWKKGSVEIPGANQATLTLTSVQPTSEGEYSVVVWNRAGTNSATVRLEVVVPVSIATQPADRTVIAGESTTLSATANGTAPIFWRWYFRNAMVVGGTGGVLELSGVTAANEGDYFAIVTNEAGSATTRVARVSVVVPAQIVTQPVDQTAGAGGSVTFSVSATGTAPLTYQWSRNGVALEGKTEATLVLSNVQTADVGEYAVRIGNSAGFATSRAAVLTVLPAVTAPMVVKEPENQTVFEGAAASFTVEVAGSSPLTLKWWHNGAEMPGLNSLRLNITGVRSTDAGEYWLTASNSAGQTQTRKAMLEVRTVTAPEAEIALYAGILVKGTPTLRYRIEYADRVIDPNTWSSLGTLLLTNEIQLFYDSTPATNRSRIYRVVKE